MLNTKKFKCRRRWRKEDYVTCLCASFELCQKTYKVNKFVKYLRLISEVRNIIYNLIMSKKELKNSKNKRKMK